MVWRPIATITQNTGPSHALEPAAGPVSKSQSSPPARWCGMFCD